MKVLGAKHWNATCALATCLLAATATAQAQTSASTAAPVTHPGTEASTTFKRWDKDNDKSLSVDEFSVGWREIQSANTLRILRDNFVAKDADKSGSLGPSEYLTLDLVQKAGASAPPLATFDADKNHSLDFKEYVGLVGTLIKSKP